jgi:hypothetical protein
MIAPGQVAFQLLESWECDGTERSAVLTTSKPDWPASHWVALPRVAVPSAAKVLATLERRAAIRHFDACPIDINHLAILLEATGRADERAFPNHPPGMSLLVWVSKVTGVAPGLYIFSTERRALGFLGSLPVDDSLFLQDEFGQCGAVFLSVADLSQYLVRYGAHGYRLCLSRGAAICNAAWIAAPTVGLAGSLFAGFIPSALRTAIAVDGLTRLPCLAFGFGYPHSQLMFDQVKEDSGV